MANFLDGYKTYIVALLTFVVGLSAYFNGDSDFGKIMVALSLLAAALRNAITK